MRRRCVRLAQPGEMWTQRQVFFENDRANFSPLMGLCQTRKTYGTRHHPPNQHRRRDAGVVSRLRHERHRGARVARCARRAQAGASAHPLRDARPRPGPRQAVQEVGAHRRRGAGQVPPAWRRSRVRGDGAHGPGFQPALPAGGRPGQLRLDRRRQRRGDALYRGAAGQDRRRDAGGHREGYGRVDRQLRRHAQGADRPARRAPQPARERRQRHRGRAWRPTSRPTTWARCATRSAI